MKEKILILISVAAFAVMMSLNITTSTDGTDTTTNISLGGLSVIASAGSENECGTCFYDPETDLEYCNFNYPGGTCDSNDGGRCGGTCG